MNILYLASIFICIFVIFYLYNKILTPIELPVEKKRNNKKFILTITTNFDIKEGKEDKWKIFCNGIDSILHHDKNINLFVDFYVINEYSLNPKKDWKVKCNKKFSFINFIQKTKDLQGQGESLNLILDLIKTYIYWIQWDEVWYSTRSFIFDAIQIMDNTKITQLQFTKENDITDLEDKIVLTDCHKMPNDNNYCILKYNIKDYPKINLDVELTDKVYSLYSIKPSINRVKNYNFGKFIVKPEYYPTKFEIEFGQRWMDNNYIKAIFLEGSVTRKKDT